MGFCCHERVFAVTRVEQMVMEAANVSLLALYKEGKSDPDPPPWTPAIHHPSSAANKSARAKMKLCGKQCSEICICFSIWEVERTAIKGVFGEINL